MTPRVWKVIEKSKIITIKEQRTGELLLPSTTNCNQILLLIDDGNGNDPASYNLDIYHYNTPAGVFMLHSSHHNETTRSWEDTEPTDQWKAIIKNVSVDTATYRLFAQGKRV